MLFSLDRLENLEWNHPVAGFQIKGRPVIGQEQLPEVRTAELEWPHYTQVATDSGRYLTTSSGPQERLEEYSAVKFSVYNSVLLK